MSRVRTPSPAPLPLSRRPHAHRWADAWSGEMTDPDDRLGGIADAATAVPGIASAAVFLVPTGSADLALVAASGIEGAALYALSAAVLRPGHPIAQTLHDGVATFDVSPTAPGGPALRSHLPIIEPRDGGSTCVGVLAVAHQEPLPARSRATLEGLAARVLG